MVIAIDGPAGSGKSTVARGVAAALGWAYLDSGAMYRCVALAAIRAGADPSDADAAGEIAERVRIELDGSGVVLDGEEVDAEIRGADVSAAASVVASHPRVRDAMVAHQRAMIDAGRYVAEGRDIGTVVSPDAPLKLFLTADEAERARRRAVQTGEDVEAVADAMSSRDSRDRGRDHSPLRPADDAVELDTTALTVDEVIARVVALAGERGLG
jgi:cytidylate kinase